MKKIILVIMAAVFVVAACKKDNPPKAAFSTSNYGYYINQPVSLTNTSTGGSTYSWQFGDGTTSSAQSPTHIYNSAGTYTITLTVNGTATASKSIKIFGGTASYQVSNQTGVALHLVSFSVDGSNQLIDFVDHDTIDNGALSDTVFTTDFKIYIGGNLPNDSTFIAVYPLPITLYTNNILTLADTSEIYVNSIAHQNSINQLFHLKTTANAIRINKQLNLLKRIAQ